MEILKSSLAFFFFFCWHLSIMLEVALNQMYPIIEEDLISPSVIGGEKMNAKIMFM